jgi:hypothetical protein
MELPFSGVDLIENFRSEENEKVGWKVGGEVSTI